MRNERQLAACAILVAALLAVGGCASSNDPASSATPSASEGKGAALAGVEKITTSSGIDMVRIPAGECLIGDEGGEPDQRPVFKLYILAFYMDTCEVTQKAYEALVGRNPSKFKGPDRPVDRVSWFDAVKYCNLRSQKEGLHPCYDLKTLACDFAADGYRLPNEAEWEYACRADRGRALRSATRRAAGRVRLV